MAENGNKQSTLTAKDITGLKYFDQIAPLLLRLHPFLRPRDTDVISLRQLLRFDPVGGSYPSGAERSDFLDLIDLDQVLIAVNENSCRGLDRIDTHNGRIFDGR